MPSINNSLVGFAPLQAQALKGTFTRLAGTPGVAAGNTPAINGSSGTITTAALMTAGGASQAITLTNTSISATSVVLVQYSGGTNTVANISISCVPAAGSATITIFNNTAATALNGTVILKFYVVS